MPQEDGNKPEPTGADAAPPLPPQVPPPEPPSAGPPAASGRARATAVAAAAAGDDDPFQEALEEAERQLAKAKKDLADHKDRAKRDEEIGNIVRKYEEVQVNFEASEDALEEHQRDELGKLKALLNAQQINAVEQAVAGCRDEIAALEESVDTQEGELVADREALDKKKDALASGKRRFDGLKDQAKRLSDKHKAADAIRMQALDAKSKGNFALSYYLVRFELADALLAPPEPLEADALEKDIRAAADEVLALTPEVSDREAALKAAEAKLAKDRKTLADLQKNILAKIRAEVAKLAADTTQPA